MSLSTYDNLTKTANIFSGGRSTFFVNPIIIHSLVSCGICSSLTKTTRRKIWSRLPYHDVHRLRKSPNFALLRRQNFAIFPNFGKLPFSANIHHPWIPRALFFFGLSTTKRKTRLHSFLFFLSPYFKTNQKNCQISIRIMFKWVGNNIKGIRMLRFFNFHNSFIVTFG